MQHRPSRRVSVPALIVFCLLALALVVLVAVRAVSVNNAESAETLAHKLRKILLQHVTEYELDIVAAGKRFRKHRLQALVKLHAQHLARTLRQLFGKAADAGSDLQHSGVLIQQRALGDVLRNPAGGQKVLPHRF